MLAGGNEEVAPSREGLRTIHKRREADPQGDSPTKVSSEWGAGPALLCAAASQGQG